jgi:hypothetical protein
MIKAADNSKRRLATHKEIAARAYEIYQERGCQHGHDMDDWLQAEYELMRLPIREIAKLDPPTTPQGKPVKKSVVSLVRSVLF